jgi:two-component system response regulator HydG
MPRKADILLVDDEQALCVAAEKILTKEGHHVTAVYTLTAGQKHLDDHGADVVITDLALPDGDGLDMLRHVKATRPDVEVIVITGHGSVERAVEAMRLGAYDFIEKPLDRHALLRAVHKAAEKRELSTENRRLRDALQQQRGEDALIGQSAGMTAVKKLIRQIAPTDVSVLIQGESGTGKEVVADVIHALSPRRNRALVKISCAAIPETLLESELFGYERGAFTGASNAKPGKFELADGGTLFLDEIAEMSPQLQAKLLRVLQDGRFQRLGSTKDMQVDVRILSASHVDLPGAIRDKKFREDLYYRLNVVHIALPALRERTDDIPLLAAHFLQKYATRMQKEVRAIAPEALRQLQTHAWPGNVRELENAMQRAIAVATDDTIQHFSLVAAAGTAPTGTGMQTLGTSVSIPVGTPLAQVEEKLIAETLTQCGGDKEKAAKILGVSARTLYRRAARG